MVKGQWSQEEKKIKKNASYGFVLHKALKDFTYTLSSIFKKCAVEGQTSVLAEQNEHADECTVQPVNHLLFSAIVAKCANHLKHRPHFRELKENDCQHY